ncbi:MULTISPECIES: hypothetical protein [unclassified Ketobacter]|uniref:hypothetical protein n=1 Tax=unclassified Ketobacter TaxID=2639109 RepID=UPI000F15E5F5|nr:MULTISPECIES: hypothetical protein [unclassified Ketobacter]MCK5792511.1 hypothetical protein [Ketobacter sp.]RLT87516.1 MAG: hypothetical protein D9N13_20730 [Ketobacter sp. GenoA1]RLT93342.1 MAG: hypothetical protein D9N15_20835 [Ketobacter sp.]
MKPLFVLFWQLCRFQKGPQDVPYSQVLLLLLLVAELALGMATILLLEPLNMGQQMLGLLMAMGAWLLLVWALLAFKGLTARYVQTMSACLGTDLLLSCIILPLQVYIVGQGLEPESGTLARLALLVALIWDILIKGRIYGASMQLGRLQANLLSITIWVIVLLLSNAFMPAPMPEQAPQNPAVEQVQPPSN